MERWRRERIIGDSYTTPQGGSTRFIEPKDMERLRSIARLHVRFGKEKIPVPQLAFWLAAEGDSEMPAPLVLQHIEDSTGRFVGLTFRVFTKYVAGRYMLDDPDPATIMRVAKPLGKKLAFMALRGAELAGKIFFPNALDVYLTSLLSPSRCRQAAKKIHGALRTLGVSDQQAQMWTPHIWDVLIDTSTFFRSGEDNALLRAVREHSNLDDGSASRLAAHANVLCDMFTGVFPELRSEQFSEGIVPLVAGLLLHLMGSPEADKIRDELDRGETERLHSVLGQVRDVRDVVLQKLRGE